MRLYLEESKAQLELAKKAQQDGEYQSAKRYMIQAAEYMITAAQQSPPPLKQTRLNVAQTILAQAQDMDRLSELKKGTDHRSPMALADDTGDTRWLIQEKPNVRFSDVAGLEDVKEQIRLKLTYPFSHPEMAERYGVRPGGGILLYGPPGTGKTMIARAIAGELDATFFSIKPSDVMSKWVGEAEQNIAQLFSAAKSYPRSVIFIDEIESMLPGRSNNSSTIMQRVVPQFLMELEGFRGRAPGLLFVGATNEPWQIDPAALRPGRFDEKIYVPLPESIARRKMLDLNLTGRPVHQDVDLDVLTERLDGYSGADIVHICLKASTLAFLDAVERQLERPVCWEDFEVALASVSPSVTRKNIQRFEQFAREH